MADLNEINSLTKRYLCYKLAVIIFDLDIFIFGMVIHDFE